MLSIGALARSTGVKIPTIRYYEQMGLITAPERSAGNQRRFASQELERLRFIKHARDLGLSLDAIRELLELNEHPERPCANVDKIAEQHLTEIREKISRLQGLERELARIVGACKNGAIHECYVLRAFSDHDLCIDDH